MLSKRSHLANVMIVLFILILTVSLSACEKHTTGSQEPASTLDPNPSTSSNDKTDLTASAHPTELTISAAVSLKDALEAFQPTFEKEHHAKLHFNFGASGQLMQQIEQGAPVDVFISAGSKQMNELQEKGLLFPDTRTDVVRNTLVLVVPKNASDQKNLTFDTLKNAKSLRLAMGEPKSVPAGMYAEEVLKHLALYDQLIAARDIVFANDVRQVLAYVETGEVDAGLVYKTDAALSDKVIIADTAQEGWHQPIVYPGAVIHDTKEEALSKAFLNALKEGEGKRILEQYGFTPAP